MADTPYVVLDGYIHADRANELEIITLGGDLIKVQKGSVQMSVPTDASADKKAVRLFLKRGTTVEVHVASEALSQIGTGTVLKYYDDGSTIRKSLDDFQAPSAL